MAIVPASLFFKGLGIYGAGEISFDLVLSENHNFDSEVTTHPVEDGSEISDHIQNELIKGDITGLITNYSINTPLITSNRAEDTFNALVELWESKTLFTMYTILNVYDNVAITSMPITLDENSADSLIFQISFREVKVVTLQEIEVEVDVKTDGVDTNAKRQVAKEHNAGRTVAL